MHSLCQDTQTMFNWRVLSIGIYGRISFNCKTFSYFCSSIDYILRTNLLKIYSGCFVFSSVNCWVKHGNSHHLVNGTQLFTRYEWDACEANDRQDKVVKLHAFDAGKKNVSVFLILKITFTKDRQKNINY